MHGELSLRQIQKEYHGTWRAYYIGFIASLFLTVLSFSLVLTGLVTGQLLIWLLFLLALAQATVQLLFFLHLGQEAKPRWETLTFYFMVLVLVIIALGSIWIIYDLNSRVMSHMEMPHD